MAETIVVREGHGLPYSKGVMAQALTATGIAPERAFELARAIERRLGALGRATISVPELYALAERVLSEEEGAEALRRFRDWQRLDRLERPLIVLIAGTTGVGKSTLAAMLAHRLGITRVIATDVIRQVLRASFSHAFMPAVHYSAYEAGRALDPDAPAGGPWSPGETGGDPDIVGYLLQARAVATAVEAIVERACSEGTPMVVEGVHIVPGALDRRLRERCVCVEALVAVGDEELHRGHFSLRGGERPADRYLARFREIRKLQDHLAARAQAAGVAVIENAQVDAALARLMDLVLTAAGRASAREGR